MNKLIKVLTILAISIAICGVFVQCEKKQKNMEILYLNNNPYYSFIVETSTDIFYSTPNTLELKTYTAENKRKLIFESELEKFKPFKLSENKKSFENIYVSNVVQDTNFRINHLFDYDVEINKSGYVKTNIYYPDELKGTYGFNIDSQTVEILSQLLYRISFEKFKDIDLKTDNVVILSNNGTDEIFKGEKYLYHSPDYSLVLSLVNYILLKNINSKTQKIEKINSPAEVHINRLPPPPAPPKI